MLVSGIVGCHVGGGQSSTPPATDARDVNVLRTVLIADIPDVPIGLRVWEPAVVADPSSPNRVAVISTIQHWYEAGNKHRDWNRVWRSVDGGATWSAGQD